MRKILSSSMLAAMLLICAPAFASLAAVQGQSIGGDPPGTCTVPGVVAANQVMVVFVDGALNYATLTPTDNVSSGSYPLVSSDNAGSSGMAIYWKVTTAASTSSGTTINAGDTVGYVYISCMAITGFAGTPTIDTAIEAVASGTASPIAINATSLQNNEVMLVNQINSGNYTGTVTVSGWTSATGSLYQGGWYAIEPTSGTANNFSGSTSSSITSWNAQLAGIYDMPSGTCTHAGITRAGAFAVPVAGVTVMRLKNGSFGTVDCATVNYFQERGMFGVN